MFKMTTGEISTKEIFIATEKVVHISIPKKREVTAKRRIYSLIHTNCREGSKGTKKHSRKKAY
jgi:hypothetical protein